MKPIIIYLDKSEIIKLTKKEFEQYIKDAYDQGYSSGYAEGKKNYWSPWWYNNDPVLTTNTTGNPPIINSPSTPETYPKITWCSNTSDLSGEILNALGDR